MIASVRGEVVDIALDHVVIEAAGVGYKVMATPSTLATLRRGTEARLITAMIGGAGGAGGAAPRNWRRRSRSSSTAPPAA